MDDPIRLLEQRVHSAVERLKGLHDERERLRDEVRTLSDRLDRPSPAQSWQVEQERIVAEVRQVLEELRGD
jgi:hypothetical protein